MTYFAQVAKAITGAIIAALTAAATGLVDDQHITAAEGVAIAIAFFTGLLAVWAIPNARPPMPPLDWEPAVRHAHSDVGLVRRPEPPQE